KGQREADKLHLRVYGMQRAYDGVVVFCVLLRSLFVLAVDFVEDLPVRNAEVVAGLVPHPQLVGEATLGVPLDQPRVVVGQLFTRWIAQFRTLRVIPYDLVRVFRQSGLLL